MMRQFSRRPERTENTKTYRTSGNEEAPPNRASFSSTNIGTNSKTLGNRYQQADNVELGLPGDGDEPYPPKTLGTPNMRDLSLDEVEQTHPGQYSDEEVRARTGGRRQITVDTLIPSDDEDRLANSLAEVKAQFNGDVNAARAAVAQMKNVRADQWPDWVVSAMAWISSESQVVAEGADVNQHPVPPRDEANKNHGDGRDAPGAGGPPANNMPGPVPVPTPLVEQTEKENTPVNCPCCHTVHAPKATAQTASETPHTITPTEPNGMNPLGPDPAGSKFTPKTPAIATPPVLNTPQEFPEGAPGPTKEVPRTPAITTAPTLNDADGIGAEKKTDPKPETSEWGIDSEIPLGPQSPTWERVNNPMESDIATMCDDDENDEKLEAMCKATPPWEGAALASYTSEFTSPQMADDGHMDDIVHHGQVSDLYYKRFVASGNVSELQRQAASFKTQRTGMGTLKACGAHSTAQREYGKKVFAYSARQMKSSLNRALRALKDPRNANPEKMYR